MDNANRIKQIKAKLIKALSPETLEVIDESHLHVGHDGAKDGRGHFAIRIRTERFNGINRIEAHRMIYDALGDLMKTDIHALRIECLP